MQKHAEKAYWETLWSKYKKNKMLQFVSDKTNVSSNMTEVYKLN